MNVKEHYDTHLGNFYSWMVGDFNINQKRQQEFFVNNDIQILHTGIAIDLGAGHGLHSVSLAKLGFRVVAIDFNQQLIEELKANSIDLPIEIINDDIRLVKNYKYINAELIICAGDTIAHLDGENEIKQFINDCAYTLCEHGKLILSFRDYSHVLTGNNRFIPVRSDESKILTCCLDYLDNQVLVTDILNIKVDNLWHQRVSSYSKTRVSEFMVLELLKKAGFKIFNSKLVDRMVTIIAQK